MQGSSRIGKASSRVRKGSNRVGRPAAGLARPATGLAGQQPGWQGQQQPDNYSSGRSFHIFAASVRIVSIIYSTKVSGYGFRTVAERRLQPTREEVAIIGQSSADRLRDFHSDLVRSIPRRS